MDILTEIGDFYRPIDSVNVIDKNIKSEKIKRTLLWALLIASGVFFVAGGIALIQALHVGKEPRMNIVLYLFVLAVMLSVDTLAVYFEAKGLITKAEKLDISNTVSISVSVIAGLITLALFIRHFKRYLKGYKHSEMDMMIITIVKMIVAVVVFFRSYQWLFVQIHQ